MPPPRAAFLPTALFAFVLGTSACDERTPSTLPPAPVPSALHVRGGDGQQGVVGAELPEELAVEVVDAAGRPMPGVAVRFAVVAGGGQVATATATSDGQGLARTRWTLGTVAADSQVVEARLDAVAPVRLRAQVRPDVPAALGVSGGGAAGQVGAALADSLAVTVKDRYGNPVAGLEVAWAAVAGGGSLSPARVATGANGVARAQWTLGPRVDSAQVAVARVAGLDSATFAASAVTTGVPLQLAKRGGDGQRGPAGGVLADSLGVVLRLPDGRPVAGAVVAWSVPPGAGTVAPAVSRTDATGAAAAVWRLGTTPGLAEATATVDEGTLRFTSLIEADAPALAEAVSGGGTGGVGQALADSLAVRVTDRHGNPVPGAAVDWSAVAGGGAVSPARSATDARGIALAQWTLGPVVGAGQWARATVEGLTPAAFSATAVTAGVPLQLAKRGGDGQRGVIGSVLADSLAVVLRLPDGRGVAGALVRWSVPAAGGTVAPAESRTDANGAASAVWRVGMTPGVAQASAAVDEGTLVFTALAEADAPAQMVAVSGGGEGPVGGALADSLAVRVTDQHGNPVPGAQVAWAAMSGGGAVQPARSTTNADGVARAQWTLGLMAGAPGQTASATLGTLPPVSFSATGITAGVVLQWVRTGGNGQTGPVGSVLPDSLAVQLRTLAGAPVQGAYVTWAVTAGGGQVSPTTARTDAQGRARAAWTMGTSVGPAQATARVDDGMLTFSATARVGPPAVVSAFSGSGQSATRGIPLEDSIVARVEDAYGNPVEGVEVRWSVVAGAGHVEHPTATSGADGTVRTRWAMGFTPGENAVTATADGLAGARFTALGMAGTLRLTAFRQHKDPLWDRLDLNIFGIAVALTAYVVDGAGQFTISPAITFEEAAQPGPTIPDWSFFSSQAMWTTGAFFRRPITHVPSAVIRFEDQRVEFAMDSLAFLGTYRVDLSPQGGPFSVQQTVQVEVRLMDVLTVIGNQAYGYRIQLADDNGWTGEALSGGVAAWPLGTKTGMRTLTACFAGTNNCGTLQIPVDP